MSIVDSASQPAVQGGVQRLKSAATRAALIAAARTLFGQAGYHATSTPQVVALASVTRGALYHHFSGKEDLFEAVFLQLDEELALTARATVAPMSGGMWDKMLAALTIYLRQRADSREAQRILLLDGPTVVGWERWRALQSNTLEGMAYTFHTLMDQGVMAVRPPEPLAQQVVAALNEAALSIAHAASPRVELSRQTDAFLALVEGLRIGAAAPSR